MPGSAACWWSLGSKPAFLSSSSPMELEGMANCGGMKSWKVSSLSGRRSVAEGGPVDWLAGGGTG